ncbi:MAG: sulfatase activating formylglycine-generating enzyme [Planctomycetota bacterium]|jgi:formylglycine-generating enzyme required for sulfatase activity
MSLERDESIFGALDMSGGVSEWIESEDVQLLSPIDGESPFFGLVKAGCLKQHLDQYNISP